MLEMLMLLIVAHFIADYPLQGEFLALAKNHSAPIPFVPWYQAMTAHAAIHAGFVGVITGLWWLGLAEFLMHFLVDYSKCAKRLSFNEDRLLHIVGKVVWVVIAFEVVK